MTPSPRLMRAMSRPAACGEESGGVNHVLAFGKTPTDTVITGFPHRQTYQQRRRTLPSEKSQVELLHCQANFAGTSYGGQKGGARCRKPVITVPFDADFSMFIRLSASTHAATCNRTQRERHPPTPKGSGQLETLAMRRRASTARGDSCIFWSRMLFLSCKPIIDN